MRRKSMYNKIFVAMTSLKGLQRSFLVKLGMKESSKKLIIYEICPRLNSFIIQGNFRIEIVQVQLDLIYK